MNADKFCHPTKFTGNWPDWNGYTWLDWVASANCYHPGEDYNFGYGDQDLGQDIVATAAGTIFHTSKRTTGYGNLIIMKHLLGYKLKRFIKETYGIDTNELYSLYAHLKDILVAPGNKLEAGALIAHVGKTGTRSPHLHFELYSLWKDLKNTSYRFYPVGWSKEKVKENWLPAYQFIESTKNLESYNQFLGKPKEYWLQVEKDRENFWKQLEAKDAIFLKVQQELERQLKELKSANSQLGQEIAKLGGDAIKLLNIHKNQLDGKDAIIEALKGEIVKLENQVARLLSEQAEDYEIAEAFKLFIRTLKKLWKRGEK